MALVNKMVGTGFSSEGDTRKMRQEVTTLIKIEDAEVGRVRVVRSNIVGLLGDLFKVGAEFNIRFGYFQGSDELIKKGLIGSTPGRRIAIITDDVFIDGQRIMGAMSKSGKKKMKLDGYTVPMAERGEIAPTYPDVLFEVLID